MKTEEQRAVDPSFVHMLARRATHSRIHIKTNAAISTNPKRGYLHPSLTLRIVTHHLNAGDRWIATWSVPEVGKYILISAILFSI